MNRQIIPGEGGEFYFLRHGQTAHNSGAFVATIEDLPLTAEGRAQIARCAPHIAALPIQAIYYSPLRRAHETRDIIAHYYLYNRRTIRTIALPELAESSRAVWDILEQLPRDLSLCMHAEIAPFVERVYSGLERARADQGPVLLIAHLGVYWVLCCLLQIEPPWQTLDNGVLLRFWHDATGWKVVPVYLHVP